MKAIERSLSAMDAAVTRLAKHRNCDCELVGIEPALELARATMGIAMLALAQKSRGEAFEPAEIELAYYALVVVATIVGQGALLALHRPAMVEQALASIAGLIEALTPHLG